MKRKILYNPASGEQRLKECKGVSSDATVLWDEKIDGKFPKNKIAKVGGFTRVNGKLVFSQTNKDAHDSAKTATNRKQTDKEVAFERLKAVVTSDPILKDIIKVLTGE